MFHPIALLTLWCTAALAQTPPKSAALEKVEISLGAHRHIEQTYSAGRLLYVGTYTCEHAQRCGPQGLHYVYNLDGSLQRVIEYRFSRTRQFEGVPDLEWTSHFFDARGQLQKVIQVTQCGECTPMPIGTWKYYRSGKLYKTIKAGADPEPLMEEAEDQRYWPTLQPRTP